MTAREGRTLRGGAAVAGLILLYVLLVDPYLAARAESRAAINERESRLARLLSLEHSQPAYLRQLTAARETWRKQIAPRLLAAELPTIAASAISQDVRRIALQSFLEIERENVLPTGIEDDLTSVPVQFSLRGDIYGLRDFLAALEAGDSFLHLRELRVTSVSGGFGEIRGNVAPLQITVTVEGYLAGEGAGGAAGVEQAMPTAEPEEARGSVGSGAAAARDLDGDGFPDTGFEGAAFEEEVGAGEGEIPAPEVGAGEGQIPPRQVTPEVPAGGPALGADHAPDVDGDGFPDPGFEPRAGSERNAELAPGVARPRPGVRMTPGRRPLPKATVRPRPSRAAPVIRAPAEPAQEPR